MALAMKDLAEAREATATRPEWAESIGKLRSYIADDRSKADGLAAEGSADSRKRARVLRCRATKDENWVTRFLDYFTEAIEAEKVA
jgi:hypothetical protein